MDGLLDELLVVLHTRFGSHFGGRLPVCGEGWMLRHQLLELFVELVLQILLQLVEVMQSGHLFGCLGRLLRWLNLLPPVGSKVFIP